MKWLQAVTLYRLLFFSLSTFGCLLSVFHYLPFPSTSLYLPIPPCTSLYLSSLPAAEAAAACCLLPCLLSTFCFALQAVFIEHVYALQQGTLSQHRSTRCVSGVCGLWGDVGTSGDYVGREDAAFQFNSGACCTPRASPTCARPRASTSMAAAESRQPMPRPLPMPVAGARCNCPRPLCHPSGISRAWYLTAAISGAHTLGHAMPMNSGYFGWWSNPIDSSRFNNDYYQSLLFKGWRPDTALFGNAAKNQASRERERESILYRESTLLWDVTWYAVYGTRYTVHGIRYTVCSTQGTVRTAHGAQRTAHGARRTAHSVQCTACSVQQTAYSVQRTPARLRVQWIRADRNGDAADLASHAEMMLDSDM